MPPRRSSRSVSNQKSNTQPSLEAPAEHPASVPASAKNPRSSNLTSSAKSSASSRKSQSHSSHKNVNVSADMMVAAAAAGAPIDVVPVTATGNGGDTSGTPALNERKHSSARKRARENDAPPGARNQKSQKSTSRPPTDDDDENVGANADAVDIVAHAAARAAGNAAMPGVSLRRLADDPLMSLAAERWAVGEASSSASIARDDELVRDVYHRELVGGGPKNMPTPSRRRRSVLDATRYLEAFLQPTLPTETDAVVSDEHVLSIAALVCEKRHSGVPAWAWVHANEADGEKRFDVFFSAAIALTARISELAAVERDALLDFLGVVFTSLEQPFVRVRALKLVSISAWHLMSESRRELELALNPKLERAWKKLLAREAKEKMDTTSLPNDVKFLAGVLDSFEVELNAAADDAATATTTPAVPGAHAAAVCARYLELLMCLYNQLATRRYVRTLVDDRGIAARLALHPLAASTNGSPLTCASLFAKMRLAFEPLSAFEVDDHTYQPLSIDEVRRRHDASILQMQALIHARKPLYAPLDTTLCFETVKHVTGQGVLRAHLRELSAERLKMLTCTSLRIVSSTAFASSTPPSFCDERTFHEECMVRRYARPQDAVEAINLMPLFPTEVELFDAANFAEDESDGTAADDEGTGVLVASNADVALPLPLPRLSLQYLTLKDYLTRCFHLHRLESTYEIKGDVVDTARRLGMPSYRSDRNGSSSCAFFPGWSRMALPLRDTPKLVDIGAPRLGEAKPSLVLLEVKVSFDRREYSPQMMADWDGIRPNEAMFMLTVDASGDANLQRHGGVRHVRGGEVLMVFDAEGNPLPNFRHVAQTSQSEYFQRHRPRKNDSNDAGVRMSTEGIMEASMLRGTPGESGPSGRERTFAIAMDAARYHADMKAMEAANSANPYMGFNVLLRRSPEANNFKSVLECVRDVLNEDQLQLSAAAAPPDQLAPAEMEADASVPAIRAVGGSGLPEWLEDVFLGYGSPDAAHPDALAEEASSYELDFGDTFVDAEHVKESFPEAVSVEFVGADGAVWKNPAPPFRCQFDRMSDDDQSTAVRVMPSAGSPATNASLRFSPAQVNAIRLGCMRGLSLVVGPPGTGKTDVAVQILSLLHRNFPRERVLIVTHSNAALNDIFQKLFVKDTIAQRYLLRLGAGERSLGVSEDFSNTGRVDATLQRRLELLGEVERLALAMGMSEDDAKDAAYTCESAARFHLLHVSRSFEQYAKEAEGQKTLPSSFPFASFLSGAAELPKDLEEARACYEHHVKTLFDELEEYRPFEVLPTHGKRLSYLLVHQSKVVAMTTTHAALKRKDFLASGWQYDTLVMEESAQVTEIDALIPMMLQRSTGAGSGGNAPQSRLKRIVLIGDHNQLPPVVQNHVLSSYSNLEVSLFARLVRLGVPHVTLDLQGRSRETLCDLYAWRYGTSPGLRTLDTCKACEDEKSTPPSSGSMRSTYDLANAGFAHDYQFIDVSEETMGGEESCPRPHYVQNLVEAEYVVATYMYMRMIGYPRESIVLLTTYVGQRDLLEDVVARRCAQHPLFGRPRAISTVDRFQGQQSDFVLVSLVRTKSVGYVRDVRRLVVALSRARLGLYVFGKFDLFRDVAEWKPAMDKFNTRPSKLALIPTEKVSEMSRRMCQPIPRPFFVEHVNALAELVTNSCAKLVGGGDAADKE